MAGVARSRSAGHRGRADWRAQFLGAHDLEYFGGQAGTTLGNGDANDAALEDAIESRLPLIVNPTQYRINQPVIPQSGFASWMKAGGSFLAPFGQNQSDGLFANADMRVPLTGLLLVGWRLERDVNTRVGRMFSMHVNGSRFLHCRVHNFGPGGAMFIAGYGNENGFFRATNPDQDGGCAGIRNLGAPPEIKIGNRHHHFNVVAGDACAQDSLGAQSTSPFFGFNSHGTIFEYGFGYSYDAEVVLFGIGQRDESDANKAKMIGSIARHIRGAVAQGRGISVASGSTTEAIEAELINLLIRCSADTSAPSGFDIHGDNGPVTVRTRGVRIEDPFRRALWVKGQGRIISRNDFFGAPRDGTTASVQLEGSDNDLQDGHVVAGGGHGIMAGTGGVFGDQADRVRLANMTVSGVPDDKFAINLNETDEALVTGGSATPAPGATTAGGLRFGKLNDNIGRPGATRSHATGFDVTAMPLDPPIKFPPDQGNSAADNPGSVDYP